MTNAVALDIDGAVGVVRLQRPHVHNALDPATLTELVDTIERVSADPDIKALVLAGSERAFCTGEDLKVAATLDAEAFQAQVAQFQRLATALRSAPQPVIAAVAGYAYGAGLEIAVNCDARIAAPNARFACPEVSWGLTLTNGSSVLLRRLIGDGWAREILLFGAVADAETAERIGLVTRVVAADELEQQAIAMARAVAEASAPAVKATKALLNGEPATWDEVLDAEVAAVVETFASGYAAERLRRFIAEREGRR